MWDRLRYIVLGPPLMTMQFAHKKLNKIRALAAFSPDALSSIAYANQELYLGLLVAGSAGLSQSLPIALVITGLLTIVALSYFQTICGYPSGGGSYAVARENLGTLFGLVTAAALLIDYVLTAAVSLTASITAIASAFPELWPYHIGLSLLFLSVITLLNLRGLRETGTMMAIPVYLFLFVYLSMLAYGMLRVLIEGSVSWGTTAPPATEPLTLFLILHAFSTGCTALTGIEAISNGVPVFKPPEAKNARQTLVVMALLMGILFLGSVGLTQFLAVVAGPQETILSALARMLLGSGPAYWIIQASTMLVLAVAANTSFAGFPRLAAILASDGFLPRQLRSVGDRLVFAKGILLLTVATGVLILGFGGYTHALIPLFAVGVFLAFTLSQIGMVVHWRRERGKGWWLKVIINGVGALATGVTVVVVGANKFFEGAWITILLIPMLVVGFLKIREHYHEVDKQLSFGELSTSLPRSFPVARVIVPIAGVNRGMVDAIAYAQSISKSVTAVYIELEPGSGQHIREEWKRLWPNLPLVILPSPYRSIVGPFLDFLDEIDGKNNDSQLAAVVLPEWVPAHWWQGLLHNQTARLIRNALLYRRRHLGFQRVIIEVPYHLRR
ncbi:MAG: APC family permease [Candidatus Bathyarchaeota archaeon]|nr:APC family permease [Candidatus Bathyarchaeota archaeon]